MKILCLIAAVSFTLMNVSTSTAQAPDDFTFQGVLLDDSDNPVNATVTIVSRLYAGATLLHEQTHNSVSVENGIFSIVIANTDSISFDQSIEVGITVNGDPEILPRTPILMAPYAQSLIGFRVYPVNKASFGPNLVGGYPENFASTAVGSASVLGGGAQSAPNSVNANYAVVAGGFNNQADGQSSGILAGSSNTTGGTSSTIAGGTSNSATGNYSVVSGGQENIASGLRSMVPGGRGNVSGGILSFAGGEQAAAVHNGAFVWQDATAGAGDTLFSTAVGEFRVRASGGVAFLTESAPDLTTGVFVPAGGSGWAMISSRATKTDYVDVDPVDYLDRLASLDIKEWRYKTESGNPTHVGPFAEDFYEQFGHGSSNKTINTIDADGVALVAIQGLYRLVQEQAATIRELQSRLDRLE